MISRSAQETREIGMRLAAHLKRGDVVLLEGDLGAGKSELARGVARGLGIEGPAKYTIWVWMKCWAATARR